MSQFYDGTKLLSLSDLNGNKPEIYISTTNRSGGKTVYFSRLLVNRFIEGKGKFMLIYRFNYEMADCSDKFFKDIGGLFFPGMEMSNKRKAQGMYQELYLDGAPCGYAVSLNAADQLKKYSHLFSDVQRMLFDEFQSETNHYCPDELRKFISIHISVSRGKGEQARHVPVYMVSNPVSLINPYYTELGISQRLNLDTRFLKGDGFVMEQGFVESARAAQMASGFNKAFASNAYMAYSSQSVYLNDNSSFVEYPSGQNRYICTLKAGGAYYAIREYAESGFMFVDDKPDMTFTLKITVTSDDHQVNYIMLKNNDVIISTLRYYFEKGLFRFKDLKCKDALLKTISY